MKLKNIIYILFICILTITYGCESDWMDVNHDPDSLGEITDPEILMPTAEVSLANQLMGWDMGITGAFWSQYFTQSHTASQFRQIDQYYETDFSGTYTELTAGTLNDLAFMKDAATKNDNVGSYLIAEALSIYTWQVVTDTWGTVPYFEALQGSTGIFSPNFDSGESIYADLLLRCDNLLDNADIYLGGYVTPEKDFIYGGHLEDWISFVKSLKLKLLLRQSETSSYNNVEVLQFVEDNKADFLTTSAMIDGDTYFENKNGSRHPMAEFEMDGAGYFTTNVIASKTFLDYLRLNGDTRLASIFIPGENGQVGAFQGDFFSDEDSDGNGTPDDEESYSTCEFSFNDNLYLMTTWEINFYIAEVYSRANDLVTAQEYYENAVSESCDFHGVDADMLGSGEYAEWVPTTTEEAIHLIGMQKWVAYAKTQHWEAFLERNRTKYPSVNEIDIASDRQSAFINFPVGQFVISVNGRAKLNGNLPSSPTYPQSILTRNNSETVPGQKSDVGEKIWWDQKQGK
ncbi:SusD/RagB family nutrient-binding outer membrane lipoprotein [Plebeiibacterium sediminum]|uniref:SusD/RagB family nutrient-binding outer membrane lipoprotein n=1 Tax=Plebeiibacterium sediminum TaxID=2992112 RepID=A0AAE3SHP4_9BACT|nr:SusD/RagB family nutrient-binding outer membrane lipoprotein [Plebeiobacterium sediminum]MCW3789646.1 SusD/RagB family nutrient-binding outer membrane lipoprotein [Plebeiobacterium sediminum]